ncbi:BcsR/BcsP family cellulose biosynthesis protein [Orrella marina]|uniref:Cellulose biosynthesis protein BcsR n=1 Tax=Orrella marina TaxID=2163011 RepID=A0A2R4XM03_9BURK|nr:BcsR/BcsP family cellulose biosynthesis protein [Orrella marina]AWB34823.1 hypothetical protein DBV39_15040 [Orrella marina]
MNNAPDSVFELHTGSTLRPADDLVSLKQHLPGGQFHYVDIATQQAREDALIRWPLLAEVDLHAHRSSRSRGPLVETEGS